MSDREHRIQLRGPWDVAGPFAAPVDPNQISDWRRITIPATWSQVFGDRTGVAWFRRSFNQPTNLGKSDRVWLELPDHAGEVVAATLNGEALYCTGNRLVTTPHLRPFNTLLLSLWVTSPAEANEPHGLHQPVCLVITSSTTDAD